MSICGNVRLAVCLAMLLASSGCASIVNGRHADVAFNTFPASAHVTVRDDSGRKVAELDTPGDVALKRSRPYFLPARYTATIEAPGYAPAEVPIRSTVNPWILGNIVFGGIPGLVVDSATGAAWRPMRREIVHELAPLDGGIPTGSMPPVLPLALTPGPLASPPLAARP
jgi:uncharacterized protein YceK